MHRSFVFYRITIDGSRPVDGGMGRIVDLRAFAGPGQSLIAHIFTTDRNGYQGASPA